MSHQGKVFQVFYSKDVRKKKKVYSEGILLCEEKRTKLFSSEGELVVSLNSRSSPIPDDEYTINNAYVVVVEKEVDYHAFTTGKIFIQKEVPVLPSVKPFKNKTKPKQSLHKLDLDFAKTFENGLQIESFIYSQLREHQVEGVRFMYECLTGLRGCRIQGCILADFMGLGKTLQTLTLVRCLLVKKVVSKVVVICPLTLVKVWERESVKWMGSKLNPLVAFGSVEDIAKAIRMFVEYQYRFLVASYQQFYKHADSLGSKCDLMIFDEGHRLKNKKGKLFQKIQRAKCRRRVLLTGTPIQNNLEELYTCISLVNPAFFDSETVFKNVFQKPIIAGMAKNASQELRSLALTRTSELANLIKEFSLRRKADVLETYLPKKREYQIFLKLSPLQLSLYDRILKRKINDSEVLSYLNQMRKLFTHPVLFKTDRFDNCQWKDCWEDCREERSYKIEFVRQVALACREANEKVVVVSYFTETLDFIQRMLEEEGLSWAKLDGRLEGRERYNAIENFIKVKTVLLLSGKAGGTGLTLTCACKMVLMEPDWNPSNDSQVMGRVWRQGQTKEVEIYRLLVASSFEQKILQRQQLKQSLSQKLIDQQTTSCSYDFFSLKQLFLEIGPSCITYPKEDNQLEMCRGVIPHLGWENTVHVQIIESHQQTKRKAANQFEEAEFGEEEEEEEGKEKEDVDQDEQDLEFIELREQYQNGAGQVPQQLPQLAEVKEEKQSTASQRLKSSTISVKEQAKQEQQAKQAEEVENLARPNTVLHKEAQNDLCKEQSLPVALRKFKKRAVRLQE